MAPMLVSAAKQVRQFICGIHGHDALLHFDQRHVSLMCVVCGHQTPGWNLPGAAASSRIASPGHESAGYSHARTPHHGNCAAA